VISPTFSVPEASLLLGVGADHGYNLVARGAFPVPVIRLGRKVRVPARPLLDLLGLSDEAVEALFESVNVTSIATPVDTEPSLTLATSENAPAVRFLPLDRDAGARS
jgi:hypothetical protein